LDASGKTFTRSVHVRTDPRVTTTPEALRARWTMITQIDSIARTFAVERRKFITVDSEYTRLAAILAKSPSATDSAVKAAAMTMSTLRARFGSSYPTPIGQAFDLLGGLESSSATPTEAEERTLRAVQSDLADAYAKLETLVTTQMPKLRALVASRPAP
jgi:hypothetical protein